MKETLSAKQGYISLDIQNVSPLLDWGFVLGTTRSRKHVNPVSDPTGQKPKPSFRYVPAFFTTWGRDNSHTTTKVHLTYDILSPDSCDASWFIWTWSFTCFHKGIAYVKLSQGIINLFTEAWNTTFS